MGALYFMILMAFLFCFAMFFITASTIFLIIRRKKKRKGKLVKKRWFVIPLIILIFNILVACIPIGFVVFLRVANSSQVVDIVYAESGKKLYWPIESNTNWFEMDGTKYVQFREGFSGEPFFRNETEDKHEKPVANIWYNPANSNVLEGLLTYILTGSTADKLEVSAVYPLINKHGFKFFEVAGTAGNDIFCPKSKINSIKAYYANISNYDTQNLTYKYSVYTDEKKSGDSDDTPYIEIEKNVKIAPGVFRELDQAQASKQGIKRVKIPKKYIDLDKAAKPGTSIFGYKERWLYAYSNDKLFFRDVILVLINGQVYVEQESGYNYITGYPLHNEMNQYIIKTVFAK